MHSGARQWRHDCNCLPAVAEARHSQPWERMHSQVSARNIEYFVDERRVGPEIDIEDLRAIHEQATDQDAALLVCNVCGTIRVVDR